MTATKSPVVERNRKNKKAFILDTAARLFAEFGFNGTTMDMLSETTGLNKGTMYYYYTSKPDILFDICVATTEKHFRVISAASKMSDAIEALDFFIESTVHFIIENRDYCKVYYQEGHFFGSIFDQDQLTKVRQQQARFMKNIYAVLENGISTGQFREMNVRNCGRLIYGTAVTPYQWRQNSFNADEVIAEIRALLLNGLQSR